VYKELLMPDATDTGLLERFRLISGNNRPSDNMQLFLEHAPPDVAERFLSMLDAISGAPALEPRIKALIRVVVCMVVGHELGVKSWTRSALASGATPEEVVEALYTVIPQVGAIPIIRMLPAALSATQEAGDPNT
jgi:alkylhydroperoxidase/carboxymuconolactone decarboxylase family protein YurZ